MIKAYSEEHETHEKFLPAFILLKSQRKYCCLNVNNLDKEFRFHRLDKNSIIDRNVSYFGHCHIKMTHYFCQTLTIFGEKKILKKSCCLETIFMYVLRFTKVSHLGLKCQSSHQDTQNILNPPLQILLTLMFKLMTL